MSPQALARAADPFFTTKGVGKGLGLSMVHGLAAQSNGRLVVESELGRCTTVRLFLPVADRTPVEVIEKRHGYRPELSPAMTQRRTNHQ